MGSVDQIKMKDLQTEAEKKPFAAAVKALWIEMFEDKESYVDHYMSSTWKHNRVLLLLRGEEIVRCCILTVHLHCAGRAARSAITLWVFARRKQNREKDIWGSWLRRHFVSAKRTGSRLRI